MSAPLAYAIAIRTAALPRPLTTSRGTWSERRGVLLRLVDTDGRVGLGEATPLPGFSPDDADACARAIEAVAPHLDPEDVHVPPRFAPALAHLPCARFALETALADLAAQRRGISVAELLGGASRQTEIALSGIVDLTSPTVNEDARARVLRGITTIKAKVGVRARAAELASLESLRAEVGDGVKIRLDANGIFDLAGARSLLADVAPFSIELVEEPTTGATLLALGETSVPWAADESLQDARIADALLASPCAAFVIKPQFYGLHAARARAIEAQKRGKHVIVTHLFDGPIALAIACELALSFPTPPLACGLDAHASLDLFGPAMIPQLARAARAVSCARGLGVTFTSAA